MNNYYENYEIRSAAQLQPATARLHLHLGTDTLTVSADKNHNMTLTD